jgi:nitrogen regulatory protein P-II 1
VKEIRAYVHKSRVADVIAALKASKAWGVGRAATRHNLAVYVVKGSLMPLDSAEQRYSVELGDEVVNEYKLELICDDHEVDDLIAILVSSARTGQAIAGWITVSDIDRALPIR